MLVIPCADHILWMELRGNKILLPSESVYVVKLWVSKDLVMLGSSTIVIQVRWLLLAVSRMVVDSLMEQINFATDSRCYPFPGWLRDHDPPFHPTLENQMDGQRCVRHPFQVACWVKGPGFHSNFAKTRFSLHQNQGFYRAFQSSRPAACDLWLLWGNPWPLWVPPLCDAWEQLHPGESWCLGLVTGESGEWWLAFVSIYREWWLYVIIIDYWLSLSWLLLPKNMANHWSSERSDSCLIFTMLFCIMQGWIYSSCLNHVGKR